MLIERSMKNYSLNKLLEDISFSYKIGEGAYREVYKINDDVCVKTPKKYRTQDYGLFSLNFPSKLYTKLKFWVSDFNELEFKEYEKLKQKIPRELSANFTPIIGLTKKDDKSLLFQKLIKDYDGRLSLSLDQRGKIKSELFWDQLLALECFFIQNDIGFFNISPDNIFAKKINEKDYMPTLMDYKRIGVKTYPCQPQLLFDGPAKRKINRRFDRLFKEYKI